MTVKIYQGDYFVGTVPDMKPISRAFIFQVRPGDFVQATRDGETVLQARQQIGPGDFCCLDGYLKPDGSEPTESDLEGAMLFEAMAQLFGAKQ